MIKQKSKPPKKTTYIVKDVFKEQDPDKRNQKVIEIIEKQMKKAFPSPPNIGTHQSKERMP